MTQVDTVFLFQGGYPHSAHIEFAEALSADLRHFETGAKPTPNRKNQDCHSEIKRLRAARQLSNYDVVIAEGTAALQTLLSYGLMNSREATTILLACDETFAEISDTKMHYVWQFLRILTRRVDGCISISNLEQSWVRPYLPSARHEIVNPTTTPEKYDALLELDNAQPEAPTQLLSVGSARPMKNYDSLVSAVGQVRKRTGRDVQLTLVGSGHESESYTDAPFINISGFIDLPELYRHLEEADLYVQSSQGDGFGVAALEAMLAGLPVLVSSETGIRELLPDEWVMGTDTCAITKAIDTTLATAPSQLVDVGTQNRRRAATLSPDRQAERFTEAVSTIHKSR